MAIDGIDYVYLETHNWGKSVKFWQQLGFSLVLDLGTSGKLLPENGGPGIFLEEVPDGRELAVQVYLKVNDSEFQPAPPVETVGGFTPSHWGTRLMTVRDPDGRFFVLQDWGGREDPSR
jgi:hypothetical protein